MMKKFSEWFFDKLDDYLCYIPFRDKTVKYIPERLRQSLISYLAHNDSVSINITVDRTGRHMYKPKNGNLLICDNIKILEASI